MTFISTVPVDEAAGDVQAMYAQSERDLGYVSNFCKAFSHRPGVFAAWRGLLGSIRPALDPRRYELVTLAAARALRSSYCALAHGAVLRKQFYSAAQLSAIAEDPATGDLAPGEVAMMNFAGKIASDASSITQGDVQALRDHGFTDTEVFDIAAAAAARCFFSKLLDALGAEPDAAYLRMEEDLRKRLTVGRAIGSGAEEHASGE